MQFDISFDIANSPDLGSLTSSEQQSILDTANAAAAIWSRYLTPANITLDLQIKVDNSLFSGSTLAEGRPGDFVPTGHTFGSQQIYDAGSAIKLRTGHDSNGAGADLSIGLTVGSIRSMVFKTDEYASVPLGQVDALSAFLREIDHGLGMYSLAQQPGALGVSVYDTFVQNDVITSKPIFTGYNGILQYNWFAPGVPLDSSSVANIDPSGPDLGGIGLGNDLMVPVLNPDTNAHISYLDLGILQDIGVPVRIVTDGNDVLYAIDNSPLNMWDGDDTGYALAGGSAISGDEGNDRLIGNIGFDTLYGGAGDDYFQGGDGGDKIWGGTGFDTAHYFGLASDYQILQGIGWGNSYYIHPIHPGGFSDGVDELHGIEAVEWGDGSITLLNTAAPVVTAQPVSAHANRTLDLANMVWVNDADGDNASDVMYQVRDTTVDPASGYIVVNGVVPAAGTIIEMNRRQLQLQTSFVTGTVEDTIEIRAFDGTKWSAPDAGPWTTVTVLILPNHIPSVTTANISTAQHGQTLALSSLFSVSDADGDAITKYQLWDGTNDPLSGHFVVNGVAQPERALIELTPGQIAQTSFVAGTVGDTLQIRTFDGISWSAADNASWAPFTVNVTPNVAPVVTTANKSATHGQTLALSSLFSVSDFEGDAIIKYQLWDGTNDPLSGHFVVNGVDQSARTLIELTPGQIAQTSFVTGAVGDNLQIRAFDGISWSAADSASWAPFTVTPAPNNAPVVTTANQAATHGQTFALSSLFSVNDTDGDAITKYQLWDGTSNPLSGHFVVNGVAQLERALIELTPGQIAQTSFVAGTVGDTLQIRAFDGISWSAADNASWSPFAVSVPAYTLPVVTTANQTATHGQTLALSSLFSVSDADGDAITQYQLWDGSSDPLSGHFVVSGVDQSARTLIELTPGQIAQTSFLAGTAGVGDNLQIRAFDGFAWSAPDSAQWALFHITAS